MCRLAGCASLHTLDLGKTRITEVSWASCATLRILDLEDCGVVDLSPLAGCANLHTLNLSMCWALTDVSPLAGCAALHTPCAARR
mmetsp:Transcript_15926/g.49315  ORF Transcript_15926/g.49315 Transcript_15926/m.49315 type:complete len:85 (+) Transcript_15926:709-963(+)